MKLTIASGKEFFPEIVLGHFISCYSLCTPKLKSFFIFTVCSFFFSFMLKIDCHGYYSC